LADSIIDVNGSKGKISFKLVDDYVLTGEWNHDSKYLILHQYGSIDADKNNSNGRLIMGFGPSGSGKTFWADNIIRLFNSIDTNFPSSFISIDGGIYRESSKIYKLARDIANQECKSGISNLAMINVRESLFNTVSIKNMIKMYLNSQKDNIQLNLYVPETLPNCLSSVCTSVYEDYIRITGDVFNWIGLLIWQHKYASDCGSDMDMEHKCFGCSEAGKNRERAEGKKYNNEKWLTSLLNGMIGIMKAPGGSYQIHNSGGMKINDILTKSTIINLKPESTSQNISDGFRIHQSLYNFTYID
jgi:hypothetical protein